MTLRAKGQFATNLMSPDSTAYSSTILYMVYKTICANDNITLNQLRWSLNTEYLIPPAAIDAAVASLTSKSLFDCVCRWQPKNSEQKNVHLRARELDSTFGEWLDATLSTFPELCIFVPTAFSKRTSTPKHRVSEVQN